MDLLKNIAADAVVKFEPAEIDWAQAGVKIIANNKQVGVSRYGVAAGP